MPSLKKSVTAAVIAAMKSGESARRDTLRMLTAAIKQIEIDSKISLDDDDAGVVSIIRKMIKQRRDAIGQYEQGKRPDLAEIEAKEIEVLSAFLPQEMTEAQIVAIIDQAIGQTGALGMKDMGKLMPVVRDQVDGRADMGKVSALIKARLS